MKTRVLLKLLIPLVLVFFLLKLASDDHFLQGQGRTEPDRRQQLFEQAGKLFPFDSEIIFQTGVEILSQAAAEDNSPKRLEKAIRRFQRAVSLNPFHYRAHFFLAKGYFLLNRMNSDDFRRGIAALKKTAFLKKKNPEVAVSVIEVLLSLWPHLSEEDRSYSVGIFRNISDTLTDPLFRRILSAWDRGCKDHSFFEQGLTHRPLFYRRIADVLAKNQIHLEQRFAYLKGYEIHQVTDLTGKFESLTDNRQVPLPEMFDQLVKYRKNLQARIEGYYRLGKAPEEDIHTRFHRLKINLAYTLVRLHFELRKQKRTGLEEPVLERILLDYLDIADLEEKGRMLELLAKNRFFRERDLHSFYLEMLIKFRSNRDEEVMSAMEEFLGTVSYVKNRNIRDFNAIHILLADVYIKNRYLIRAEDVLLGIEAPEAILPEVYSRLYEIHRTIGDDRQEQTGGWEIRTTLEESRFIRLDSLVIKKRVYPLGTPELVVAIPPRIVPELKTYHLFQIFIDGTLRYETYTRDIPGEIRLPLEEVREVEVLIQPRKITGAY